MLKSRLIVLLIILCMCCGCGSLFKFTTQTPTYIPPEPIKTEEHKEAERQIVAYAEDFVEVVYEHGLEPRNPVAKQAAEALNVAGSSIGAPAYPIFANVIDGLLVASEELATTVKSLSSFIWEHREELEEHKEEIEEIREDEAGKEKKTEVSSGWLAWLTALGILPILLIIAAFIFAPSLIPIVVKGIVRIVMGILGALRDSATVIRKAKPELIKRIQEFRDVMKSNGNGKISSEDALGILDEKLDKVSDGVKKFVLKEKAKLKGRKLGKKES